MDENTYVPGVTSSVYSNPYLGDGSLLPPDPTASRYVPYLAPLMSAVDHAIATVLTRNSSSSLGIGVGTDQPQAGAQPASMPWYRISFRQFPSHAFSIDMMAQSLSMTVPIYLTLIFTLQVRVLLTRILEEKEKKLRASMQMMGLSDTVFWLSWLITAGIKNLAVVTVVVLVACFGGLFKHSGVLVVWVFFALFAVTCIGYCCAVTALFSKSKTGGPVGMLIYLAFAGPSYALTNSDVPVAGKLVLSLFGPTGFTLGTSILTSAEVSKVGINWSNIADPSVSNAGISLASLMGMLALDGFLYMLIAIYLNAVVPSEFGIPRHPLFCLGYRHTTATNDDLQALRDARAKGIPPPTSEKRSFASRLRHRLGIGTPRTGAGGAVVTEWGGKRAGGTRAARAVEPERRSLVAEAAGVGHKYDQRSPSGIALAPLPSAAPTSLAAASAAAILRGSRSHGDALSNPLASAQHGADGVHHAPSPASSSISAPDIEPLAPDVAARGRVHITGLSKLFAGRGSEPARLAVDDLNMTLCEGQVTCLLGHNGAGKTTAIAMLTGLYPPTAGDATVYGRSVANDMDEIRQMIGVCPQHDIIFDVLTVREHLHLFGGIKGLNIDGGLEERIDTLLVDLGLIEKQHSLASTLSGGQKRRLSVAIALVGNPRVLYLDEPSSGLDPAGRRQVWNVIQKYKHDRVIVLTTHFMDEADILGDRIALMARGTLRVCGSSLFLKARFGLGYHLAITALHDGGGSRPIGSNEMAVKQVTELVTSFVPAATLHGVTSSFAAASDGHDNGMQARAVTIRDTPASSPSISAVELSFVLPREDVGSFPALFEALDGWKMSSGRTASASSAAITVSSYSISITTMDEVFLRLATLVEEEEQREKDTLQAVVAAAAAAAESDGSHAASGVGGSGAVVSRNPMSPLLVGSSTGGAATTEGGTSGADVHDGWWLDVRRRLFGHSPALLSKGIAALPSWSRESTSTDPESGVPLASSTHDSSPEPSAAAGGKASKRLTRQIGVQLWRRWLQFSRDPRQAYLQCVMPVLFVCISLAFRALQPIGAATSQTRVDFRPSGFSAGLPSSGAVSAFSIPMTNADPDDQPLDDYVTALQSSFSSGADVPVVLSSFASTSPPTNSGEADTILLRNTSYAAGAAMFWSVAPAAASQEVGNDRLLRVVARAGAETPSAAAAQDLSFESYVVEWTRTLSSAAADVVTRSASWLSGVGIDAAAVDEQAYVDARSLGIGHVLPSTTGGAPGHHHRSLVTASVTSIADPDPSFELTIMYNFSLTTSVPVLLSLWDSAMLRVALSGNGSNFSVSDVAAQFASASAAATQSQPAAAPQPQLLQTSFDPFPALPGSTSGVALGAYLSSQLSGLYIALGYCTIPAIQASNVVSERETKSKQLQFIMGATPFSYWMATWLWDCCQYVFPWLAGMLVVFVGGAESLRGDNAPGPALLLLLLGLSQPVLTYAISFMFSKAADAQMWVRVGFSAVTMVTFFASFALEFPGLAGTGSSIAKAATAIRYIGMLFPPYALAKGFADIGSQGSCDPALAAAGIPCTVKPVLSWDVAGAKLTFMAASIPFWFAVVMLIERYGIPTGKSMLSMSIGRGSAGAASSMHDSTSPYQPLASASGSSGTAAAGATQLPASGALGATEDDDVRAERSRVLANDASVAKAADGIGAVGLRKVFTSGSALGIHKTAVHDLTVACSSGEIFGLLGPNGAGKTTSISMLVADTPPTSGSGYLRGLDIGVSRRQAMDVLGYCPQGDALFDLLTGEETLSFYAGLNGVPAAQLPGLVNAALTALDLQRYRKTRTGHYSGGNKRRLSLALAYVGAGLVVFLDEPSTGVDPMARRRMFDVIMKARHGRTTVLTTHVMEEADALCSRIGIMVDGRLACLGSSQHLKQKYGRGYVVEVHVGQRGPTMPAAASTSNDLAVGAVGSAHVYSDQASAEAAMTHLVSSFCNGPAVLRETNSGHMRFEVPSLRLADAFRVLEGARSGPTASASWAQADGSGASSAGFGVLDYSVSQTTLEQVFLRFNQAQEEAEDRQREHVNRAMMMAGQNGGSGGNAAYGF